MIEELITDIIILSDFYFNLEFTIIDSDNDNNTTTSGASSGKTPNESSHENLSHETIVEVEGREKSGHIVNENEKEKNFNVKINCNPLFQTSKKPPKMTPVVKTSENNPEIGENLVNLGIFNTGGLNQAKAACLSNICEVNKLKIVILSETGSSGTQVPKINSKLKVFHRNRKRDAVAKGGIAVFIHEDLAEDAVLLEKGAEEDNDEFVVVKINAYSPPVVVVGVYGSQENGAREVTRERWTRIFSVMNKYKEQGSVVLMGGDLNCWLGNNLGLTSNHPSVSAGGKQVMKEAENGGWFLINSKSSEDQRSHYDRTSKTQRALDFCFIDKNFMSSVKEVSLDEGRQATPYLVQMKGTKPIGRKYTDHKAIIFSLETNKVTSKTKPEVRFIKSEDSIQKFADLTDEIAEDLLPELLEKKVKPDEILRKIRRKVRKAKYSAFKPMRPSKKKIKILDDNDLYWKKTQVIEKELKNLQSLSTNNKVFATRKSRIMEERRQELSAMYNSEDVVMEDKDSILKELMKYNEELLSRKPHAERFQEMFRLKKKMVEAVEEMEFDRFETITEEEFSTVVRKIRSKKKKMFEDFLQSGPVFKHLIYHLTRTIFESEEVPEEFMETVLIALFKGKGDPRRPTSYRFLHMRSDLSRILENCLYLKMERIFDERTGETQLGGMKQSSTIEHLAMLTSLVNTLEKEKRGAVITAADVKKCFDTVFLSDLLYFLIKEGCDLKTIKIFQILTGYNKLKVQGAKEWFEIPNGCGQGGVTAARLTSAGSAEVFERKVRTHPSPMMYRGENLAVDEFVDDCKMTDSDSRGAKVSGEILSSVLDELSLEAHPEKTVQVVVGHTKYIEKMKEELTNNPTYVQGFKVNVVEAEKYLGMVVTSSGLKGMIDRNIEEKRKKAIPIGQSLRKLIRDPTLMRIGGLKSACVMIQAKLVPTLLYGCQAWLNLDKGQVEKMEKIFRKTILKILSLPKSTNYESVLNEINNIHMAQWIDMMKLNFYSNLFHIKGRGRFYRVVREELLEKVRGGVVEEMENLSEKYHLPNVLLHYVRSDDVSKAVKDYSKRRTCLMTVMVKTIPMIPHSQKYEREHYEFDVMRARAITCFNTGNLVFKDTCPYLFRTRDQGDRKCLEPACGGEDSYIHVRFECKFYRTKFVNSGEPIKDNADYILKLNDERIQKWKTPLVIPAPPL